MAKFLVLEVRFSEGVCFLGDPVFLRSRITDPCPVFRRCLKFFNKPQPVYGYKCYAYK